GITAGNDYIKKVYTYQDPEQVPTDEEAEGNHTLNDELQMTTPGDSEEVPRQMHKLSSSIMLTSLGSSILQAGQ
ncbi:hypothetical protein FO521_30845, partial [Bacillus pseudomycoides]|uniref:hypothetical protein n=1 Tax=Bacillus pseudomycoides TaxID=64104 RepID=UPI00283D6ECA